MPPNIFEKYWLPVLLVVFVNVVESSPPRNSEFSVSLRADLDAGVWNTEENSDENDEDDILGYIALVYDLV